MSFLILFAPGASIDLQKIFDWYNEQQPGLGNLFLDSIHKRLQKLSQAPATGSIRYDTIRCTIIPKFPYLIHYSIDIKKNEVIVYRLFHSSRKPLWEK
jgi:plasmid stabilization system protein ParE